MKLAALFATLLAPALVSAQAPYDLLLKGGRVIDPKNRLNAVLDVAIAQGKVAAVAAAIPPEKARRVVDATGLYVTPGLVDIHVHVFAGSMNPEYTGALGVRPDAFTFRSGVTTVVDAGSFVRAAESLDMSRAAVSRYVADLEARLGVRRTADLVRVALEAGVVR